MTHLFTPKRMSSGTGKVKSVHLSSHLVKPAKFPHSKVSVKAPKIGTKRSVGKVKI